MASSYIKSFPQHGLCDHSCEHVLIFHLPTKKLHSICWCSTWQLSCAAVNCCRSTCSSAWSSSVFFGTVWVLPGRMGWMETSWSWCPKQSISTHSLITPTSGSKNVKANRSVWCDDVCHDAPWCNNNKKKRTLQVSQTNQHSFQIPNFHC